MKEKEADEVALVIIDLVMQSLPIELSVYQKSDSVEELSKKLADAYCSAKKIVLEDLRK